MENDLSLYKAALLRCYVGIDARLPALVALVKIWPYVCVCMYVLMCVCTFLLYVCMYACMYICVCMYACMYIFVYI